MQNAAARPTSGPRVSDLTHLSSAHHRDMDRTVLASIFPSFDFPCGLVTLPAAAPVVPAIAHEGLADAPNGAAPLRRFEDVNFFAANMLGGATRRSSERCDDRHHLPEQVVSGDQDDLDDQHGRTCAAYSTRIPPRHQI